MASRASISISVQICRDIKIAMPLTDFKGVAGRFDAGVAHAAADDFHKDLEDIVQGEDQRLVGGHAREGSDELGVVEVLPDAHHINGGSYISEREARDVAAARAWHRCIFIAGEAIDIGPSDQHQFCIVLRNYNISHASIKLQC